MPTMRVVNGFELQTHSYGRKLVIGRVIHEQRCTRTIKMTATYNFGYFFTGFDTSFQVFFKVFKILLIYIQLNTIYLIIKQFPDFPNCIRCYELQLKPSYLLYRDSTRKFKCC